MLRRGQHGPAKTTITPSVQSGRGDTQSITSSRPGTTSSASSSATSRRAASWLTSLDLRQGLLYHPVSHFWPLQWAETGLFVGLAAALSAFCFWWVRHRIT